MRRRWLARVVAVAAATSTVVVATPVGTASVGAQPVEAASADLPVSTWSDDPWMSATDRLIVVPVAGPLTSEGVQRFDQILGAMPQRLFTMGDNKSQVYHLGEEVSLDEARARAATLVAEGYAAVAEPDRRVRRATNPVDDPQWPNQWHLQTVSASTPNYGIDVAGAWARSTGSATTVVAVLDTGITAHLDLDARNIPVEGQTYAYGYDMVSDTAAANDGGGRDADPSDPGDWSAAAECGAGSPQRDSSWHGTHVAGTIGAVTNNSVGVAGIDQQARLVHVRVLGKCGGSLSDVADGIRWAAGVSVGELAGSSHPANVINLSLGGYSETCPSYLQTAVDEAITAGSIIVAAAGNDTATASAYSPANCDKVITVAATTKTGARASYSNYGPAVDIAAPGGATGGYVISSTYNEGTTVPGAATYAGLAGTSMATPHVAGVISLMMAESPNLTWSEVRYLLQQTATPFPTDTDQDIGPGILNAGALYVGPPTNVTATEGDSQIVNVTWDAAPSPGDTLLGYIVTPLAGGVAQSGLAVQVASDAPATSVTGLTNGTAYTFVVESLYQDTNTYASDPSNEVVPYGLPAAPTGVVLTPLDSSVQVNWTAPNTDGGRPIIQYEVVVTQEGASTTFTAVAAATTTSATVTGLTNGTAYTATVGATNLRGTQSSTVSDPKTPAGTPGTPTVDTATPGDGYVDLAWTVPSTGGVDLEAVEIEVQPSTGTAATYSVDGASETARVGTGGVGETLSGSLSYRFRVRATNVNGLTSAYSELTDPVVPVVESEPPVLEDVQPQAVLPAGGIVQFTGSSLNSVTNVSFIGCSGATVSATPSSTDPGAVFVTAPPCAAGNVSVTVQNGIGVSEPITLRYRTVPTISELSSPTASALGDVFTITGTAFVSDEMWVTVGHQVVSGSAVTVGGGGTTLTVPLASLTDASQLGQVGVTVSVLNLSDFTVDTAEFSYAKAPNTVTVSAQTPVAYEVVLSLPFTAGATAGTLTYTGSGACTVPDSNVPSASVTGAGVCRLTANASGGDLVEAGSASFDVTVSPGTQTLAFAVPTRVTLSAGPLIIPLTATRVSPAEGEGGGDIGFEVIGDVGTGCVVAASGGGYELQISDLGQCTVRATVSALADFLAGESASLTITVVEAPTIAAVTPAFTSSAGGTTVTISGSALFVTELANPVQLACADASVSAASVVFTGTTSAVAVMPECAIIGATYLRVTTSDGSVEFPITVVQAPTITDITPTWTSLAGGQVTITGTGFVVGNTTVRLDAGAELTATVAEGGGSLTFTAPTAPAVDLSLDVTVTVGQVAGATSAGVFAYQDVPSTPATISATPGNQQVELSWGEATPNARSLTGYVVLQAAGGAEPPMWTEIVTVSASTRDVIVTGLTNGTGYRFGVLGYNEVGRADHAVSALVTPYTLAAAPTDLAAAVKEPGNGVQSGQVALTWTVPTDDGGTAISGYDVERDGVVVASLIAIDGASATVSGLANGTTYSFRVRAVTEAGPGAWSGPIEATPRDVPSAPYIDLAEGKTPTNGLAGTQILVTWLASVSNGAAVTEYVVEQSDGSGWTAASATIAGTTATVSGLTVGEQYSIRVLAVNAAGTSSALNPVLVTARDVPGAPSGVMATPKSPGNGVPSGGLSVTWSAPSVTNGAQVTSYTVIAVTASAGSTAATCTTSTTECVLTGLVNGTTYEVSVSATNAAGLSSAADLGGTATPIDVPDAPATPTLAVKTPDNGVPGGGLKVDWVAPASDNGSAVVEYEVVVSVGGSMVASHVGSGLTHTFTGLANGVSHDVTVAARNAAGWSLASSVASAMVRDVPNAPTGVTVLPISAEGSQTDGVLRISWTASVTNGATITGYDVTVSATGQDTKTCSTTTELTCDIDGLALGVAYTVSVSATNAAGTSAEATATGTPRAVPAAPAAPMVLAKTPVNGVAGGELLVTWVAPNDRGDPITGYEVTMSNTVDGTYSVPASLSISETVAMIRGLPNGVAVFVKVAAINGAGTSSASPAGTATPRDVPSAPAAPTLEVKTPANGVAATEVKATWALPSATNGAEVVAYEVVVSAGGSVVASYAGSGVTTTFTNLTVGTEYSVTVAALNAAGWSPASAASLATARDVPGAPAAPALTVKSPANDVPGGGLRITWAVPSETNGANVTNYEVVVSDGGGIVATTTSASTSVTFTGLTTGTEHSVTVAAFNAAGWSAGSGASTATPIDVPDAPVATTPLAKSPTNEVGSGQLVVSWSAPATNGSAISAYVVEQSLNNSVWSMASATIVGTTATVSGLTNGTLTYLRVSAVNGAGTSSASTPVSATPRDVPGIPSAVSAVGKTPANGLIGTQVRVSWTAPAANGGTITGYVVEQSTDGSSWSMAAGTPVGTSQTVSGLTIGSSYQFRVAAINGAGTSSASATVSATARDVPATMTAPTVEVMAPDNDLTGGQVKVSWTPSADNGAVIELFVATASAVGQPTRTCAVIAATCVLTGMTNGTAYDVVVSAVNAAGTSTASPATTATPRTTPGAPTDITMTVRNTTAQGVWNSVPDNAIKVDWTAPASTGGDAITSYTATATAADQDTQQCTTASTECTITGLTAGIAYTVTVSATNGAGTGATGTAAATARPLAVPGAPTAVVAVRGDTRLTITWTAPTLSARGGTTITGYVAQASPGGATCTVTTASCTIIGLTNGTAYTVTVAAVNSAGRGTDSVASAAVTPATLPSAPATVSAVPAGSGQLLVSWADAVGNGSAVTTYSATANPGGIRCLVTETSCTIGGLTNGTPYTFTVLATNEIGDSPASSASAAVTPVGLPSAPLRLVALPASEALTVTWEAPVDNGGSPILGYTVTAGASTCPESTQRTCSLTGLTNGTTYVVTVSARTAAGTTVATVSATPVAPPSAQEFAAADSVKTSGALGVSTAPTPGAIVSALGTGFTPDRWVAIGLSPGNLVLGAVRTTDGTVSATVRVPLNLAPGAYVLSAIVLSDLQLQGQLLPMNGGGSTVSAQPLDVAAPTVPGAPGTPTVVAGSGTGVVDVTFTAPGNDGGATITSYIVTANPGAATCTRATAGSCLVVGLTPGTAYTFTVRAINSVGDSPASAVSASFTPKARPGAATGVTATPDSSVTGRVTVAWTAASENGAAVTYVARAVQDPTKSCSTSSTTCAITGLPNYVALTFEVLTSNSEGSGPASAASTAVTLVSALPASPREAPGVDAGSVAGGTPTPGSSASISVGGFDPFEWVTITVQSTTQVLATLQANGSGLVSATVTIPSGLSVGTHYLTVLSDVRFDGTRRGVTQSFNVAAPPSNDPGTSNPGTGGGTGGGIPGGTTFPAGRVAGVDRFATSVEISRANFSPGVAVVYLATGANFADALAAGAAAGGAGPVLLTQRDSIPEATRAELSRLRPRRIVVLGGAAAITNTVLDAARSYATQSTTRLGGADRYETAADVSAATFSPNVEVVYVATGTNFADALSAGGAARGRGPVLLVRNDGIPDTTAGELTRLRPRRIVVLGGTSAVAQSVQTALAAYTTGSVSRVGGADRYATSADLSRASFSPGVAVAYVATGTNFADALSAAALGAPVLLARPTCVPAAVKAELDRLNPTRIVVLGGTNALSDGVRRLTVC